jgi:hypothetical protein
LCSSLDAINVYWQQLYLQRLQQLQSIYPVFG